MESVALVLFGIVLFSHSWNILGRTDHKLTGFIAGTVAILLLSLAIFKPVGLRYGASDEAATLCTLLPLIYAASLAAIGLWGFNPRPLGFYSAFQAAGQLVLAVYYGGVNPGGAVVEPVGVVVHTILCVTFGLLAVHLIVATRPIRSLTGWFFLASSIVLAFIGFTGGVLGLA